jgi:predicted AAA+ superfamily ATPase
MLDRLTSSNPWWINRSLIEQDPHVRAWAAAPIRWMPRIASTLHLSVPAIYTVRGPRQVGKTTAIKLMIRRSLQETPDEEVLYYSCDLDRDPDAIRDVVQAARRLRPQAARWRIFLDEVTSIPGWERGVKWLWDNTDARHDTIVVTGSSAVDLAGGADRLPGRRGRVERPDRILLPLSFSDFARLHGLVPPVELRVHELFARNGQAKVEQALVHLPVLQALFERYLQSGGFPAAVADEHTNGHVADGTLRMLWTLIENEVQRRRLDPVRAFRVIEHVVRALSHPTAWSSLAETLDADRRTAEDYARLLALMFVVLVLHRLDPRRSGPFLRAQRKLYLVDPLLVHLPHRLRQSSIPPNVPALVENAIIMALFRSEERPLVEEFAVPQALFYWKSKSGGEVDALVGARRGTPVEVKYQNNVTKRDVAALTRSFKHGVVATKESLDLSDSNYPQIPAALLLWVLAGEGVVTGGDR